MPPRTYFCQTETFGNVTLEAMASGLVGRLRLCRRTRAHHAWRDWRSGSLWRTSSLRDRRNRSRARSAIVARDATPSARIRGHSRLSRVKVGLAAAEIGRPAGSITNPAGREICFAGYRHYEAVSNDSCVSVTRRKWVTEIALPALGQARGPSHHRAPCTIG